MSPTEPVVKTNVAFQAQEGRRYIKEVTNGFSFFFSGYLTVGGG